MEITTTSENPTVVSLLTVKEVADSLHVGPATVYELIARGKLACHRVGGRGAIRVSPEQLRAYLASCESGLAESSEPFRKATPRPGAFSHLPPS
jgi:excisionase family DNA binding protein